MFISKAEMINSDICIQVSHIIGQSIPLLFTLPDSSSFFSIVSLSFPIAHPSISHIYYKSCGAIMWIQCVLGFTDERGIYDIVAQACKFQYSGSQILDIIFKSRVRPTLKIIYIY